MKLSRMAIIGITFGIGAGMSYGVSSVLVRYGVGELATPLVGASISLLTGVIILSFFGTRGIRNDLRGNRKGLGFMLMSGVVSACGIISSFFAFSVAPVVVVSPLQSTNPLFALLWSYIFIGRLEKITVKLIIGCALVVTGVILITIGRTV